MAVVARAEGPLAWNLAWASSSPSKTPTGRTEGELTVRLDDRVDWFSTGSFTWTWIELLEWLGESWTALRAEDGLPLPLDPASFADLIRLIEREARYSAGAASQEMESMWWEFFEAHDMSRALGGAWPRPLLVWREGNIAHILTDDEHFRGSWSTVRESLVALGDAISDRLSPLSDGRSLRARNQWLARDDISDASLVGVVSGLPRSQTDFIVGLLPKQGAGIRLGEVEHDEILAAARMSSQLTRPAIEAILRELSGVGRRDARELDAVELAVRDGVVIAPGAKPYEQGYLYALRLREHLALGTDQPFDVLRNLRDWGVDYLEVSLGTALVDAVACWGPRHGPAVLINVDGKHSGSLSGRRASVAHEIGHLLVDRAGALPAVEVLGGRVNPAVEARARAFAAELLLPREVAGRALGNATDLTSATRAIRSLVSRYRVSREIVAWQVRNSDAPVAEEVRDYLRSLVSVPRRF